MRKQSLFTVCALTAAVLLSACASSENQPSDVQQTAPVSAEESGTEAVSEPTLFDALPVRDYNGAAFRFLLPAEHSYEFSETDTGDIVDAAAYLRDSEIESRYNIQFEYITEPGNWAGKDTFNALITNSVLADDQAYDLVDGMIAVSLPLAAQGVFRDIMELDGINLDDPWWTADIHNTLGIAGKLFGITGSSLMSVYKSAYVMFANTTLMNQYDCGDLLGLVIDGKWTYDAMCEILRDKTQDLDSNGKFDSSDFYGYIGWDVPQRAFQTAFELPVLSHENGKLTFIGLTERFDNAVETCRTVFADKNQCLISAMNTEDTFLDRMFMSNQTILYAATIDRIEVFRDMDSDFVMVPYPKYDEAQEKYHTQIATGSGMLFIPKTVKDIGMTVDIMNAHGCLSCLDVIPTYYESALKVKYTRDERNMQVIDIINASMSNTVEFAFGSSLNSINTLFFELSTGSGAAASKFASLEKSLQKLLDKLYDNYAAVE